MGNTQSLINEGLFSVSTQLTLFETITILLISLAGGLYVRYLYWKFSSTFSSKISFGNTLLIITISVASLVAVVKSSLALSLGLVGALSVVRFRTAVKEPFNLAFLLFAICIGISTGASQYIFGLFLSIFGTIGFLFSYRSTKYNKSKDFSIEVDDIDTIAFILPFGSSINELYNLLKRNTAYYSIISMDQVDNEPISLVIKVKIINPESISDIKKDLFEIFPGSRFSFYNSPSS